MTKLDLVEDIAIALPSELTFQERQHLVSYLGKAHLEAIVTALRAIREQRSEAAPARPPSAVGPTLAERATVVVQRLRPYLREHAEHKAIHELANTTHGVLDKLLEGL